MSQTMRQLRHTLSRRLGDLWVGVIDDVTGDEVTIPARPERDNFFSNAWLYGGGEDDPEEVMVVSNAATVFTCLPEPVAMAQSDYCELHLKFSALDYNQFLLDAIRDAGAVLTDLDDSSLTVAVNDFEYDIPEGFRYISKILIEDGSGNPGIEVDLQRQVEVIPGSPRALRFRPSAPLIPGSTIRLLGQGTQPIPADDEPDTGVVTIDSGFVIAHAMYSLKSIIAAGEGDAAAAARNEIRQLFTDIELRRDQIAREHRPLPGSLVVNA